MLYQSCEALRDINASQAEHKVTAAEGVAAVCDNVICIGNHYVVLISNGMECISNIFSMLS